MTFCNPHLARLCNSQAALEGWTADGVALVRLLNELDCIERFDDVRGLPHVDVAANPRDSRFAIWDTDGAHVLLQLEDASNDSTQADSATVFAVAVGTKECNPEGERWPQGCALSQITP